MSAEQVQKVRDAFEALNRGDVEAVIAGAHEDAVWLTLRSATEGEFVGHEGIRAFFRDNEESFDDFRVEFGGFQELGEDRVLAWGKVHVTGKGSGVRAEQSTASVVWFRDGKVSRVEDFGTREKALASQR